MAVAGRGGRSWADFMYGRNQAFQTFWDTLNRLIYFETLSEQTDFKKKKTGKRMRLAEEMRGWKREPQRWREREGERERETERERWRDREGGREREGDEDGGEENVFTGAQRNLLFCPSCSFIMVWFIMDSQRSLGKNSSVFHVPHLSSA